MLKKQIAPIKSGHGDLRKAFNFRSHITNFRRGPEADWLCSLN
jgi:hypothetical protein